MTNNNTIIILCITILLLIIINIIILRILANLKGTLRKNRKDIYILINDINSLHKRIRKNERNINDD